MDQARRQTRLVRRSLVAARAQIRAVEGRLGLDVVSSHAV